MSGQNQLSCGIYYDEGQPIFPTGKPSFLRPKDNDVYLKDVKEGITSYIKMWKDTIGNENSPIVTEESNKNLIIGKELLMH